MTSGLNNRVFELILAFESYDTSSAMMDDLDAVVYDELGIHVTGFMVLPCNLQKAIARPSDYFIPHHSVPTDWIEEWTQVTRRVPDIAVGHAISQPLVFTDSELSQKLNPVGEARAAIDLKFRYGARERIICSVSGKWIFGYWSKYPITLTDTQKHVLHLAAETFCHTYYRRFGDPESEDLHLTRRERTILSLASLGRDAGEIAEYLGISPETVKAHQANCRQKLGSHTIAGAVGAAMRNRLIP